MADKKIGKTIGFIGAGNMATAILKGVLATGKVEAKDIFIAHTPSNSGDRLATETGAKAVSKEELAKNSDVILLCVKPGKIAEVIGEIKADIKADAVIISIAAGTTLGTMEDAFGKKVKIVRVMPNTPALVGEGMSALTPNEQVSDEDLELVKGIFNSIGKCEVVPESMMDAVVGVSGSSPAYVYMFIEAMADAAVLDGMPRQMAYDFAAQSVLGAAKMVLDTGEHPGVLKDKVCSPGGTTIEAVAVLEREGFREAIISAQHACVEKSKDMSKK